MKDSSQIISTSLIRQIVLIFLILILAGLVFYELRMFLPSVLGAYTLYILLRRPYFYLTVQKNWNSLLSTILLISVTILILILPAQALVRVFTTRMLPYIHDSKALFSNTEQFIKDLEFRIGMDIISEENIADAREWLVNEGRVILSATLDSIAILVVMYFLLYYLLINSKQIERRLLASLPMDERVSISLKKHLNGMIFSNAIGVPLVALFQSLVAMVGFMIAGIDEPLMWTFMTFITSFIPIVGSMLIYIPLSIMLVYNGEQSMGIFLFLFCFILVGSVDNVFRFWLQKKIGDTHPLITIFGVIAGVKLFGFLGLIFGPILISTLLLLIEIYAEQYFGASRSET